MPEASTYISTPAFEIAENQHIPTIYFRKIWDFDITGVPNFVNFSDGTAKALYRVRLLEFNFSGCSSSNFLHQQIILSPKEMVYLLQIFILS